MILLSTLLFRKLEYIILLKSPGGLDGSVFLSLRLTKIDNTNRRMMEMGCGMQEGITELRIH